MLHPSVVGGFFFHSNVWSNYSTTSIWFGCLVSSYEEGLFFYDMIFITLWGWVDGTIYWSLGSRIGVDFVPSGGRFRTTTTQPSRICIPPFGGWVWLAPRRSWSTTIGIVWSDRSWEVPRMTYSWWESDSYPSQREIVGVWILRTTEVRFWIHCATN